MAGCTNCAGKSSCDQRKGSMFAAIDGALERLYPDKRWGQPDDLARFEAGVSEYDAQRLCEELAVELNAATFYRPGGSEEYCNYIYVLCVGREPCLVQLRDAGVAIPDELNGNSVREQYLRLCLSDMARMAAVQQVAIDLDWDREQALVCESPRSGVYDAPLLPRFQRLVALLPAFDIVHLDFGEISEPPSGYDPGSYGALYGGRPHVANYLFYPQPSTMRETTLVDTNDERAI